MAVRKRPSDYQENSIRVLKGLEPVKSRPGMYTLTDNPLHIIQEVLDNASDEVLGGFGDTITLTMCADGRVAAEDNGRGIPVDYNKREERYNWELVFCEMYAGGKYNNNDGGNYDYALGLNGLGLCATQYASEYMDADIRYDGFRYTLHFEHGENVGGLNKEPYGKKATGSRIRWKPDIKVFTDIDVPADYYTDIIKRQAIVNAGVKFILKNEVSPRKFETTEFCYENGILDHVRELVGEDALTSVQFWQSEKRVRDREDLPLYNVKINAAVAFSNRVHLTEYYHNSSWLEYGGAPDKAVQNAFVYQIDAYLKQNGKYNKSESKIKFQDVEDCLVIVMSSFSTMTSYENQTKKAINNKFIQETMTEFLKSQLEVYFIENPFDAQKIAEQVLLNKRSREVAENTRLNIKKKLSGSVDISNRVQKFVDCRTKDTERRELYIVEGDSALGSVKLSRDAEFQGIMPVRGKILNCLKADYGKIFKSDIITDLLKVLGCGVEVKDRRAKDMAEFDLMNLRWSKIVICTDADVDGFQIRTLILTMLYRLTPTLIQRGYVYIAESPLYEINYKEKTWFAYSDKEKNDILGGELRDKKCIINRSKGLGENEPEMMWLTTMNPATRRLIRVMPEDVTRTAQVFDLLLGDNLTGRKTHIADNGYKSLELADIS